MKRGVHYSEAFAIYISVCAGSLFLWSDATHAASFDIIDLAIELTTKRSDTSDSRQNKLSGDLIKTAFLQLSYLDKKSIQIYLALNNFYSAEIDGLWGRKTSEAVLAAIDNEGRARPMNAVGYLDIFADWLTDKSIAQDFEATPKSPLESIDQDSPSNVGDYLSDFLSDKPTVDVLQNASSVESLASIFSRYGIPEDQLRASDVFKVVSSVNDAPASVDNSSSTSTSQQIILNNSSIIADPDIDDNDIVKDVASIKLVDTDSIVVKVADGLKSLAENLWAAIPRGSKIAVRVVSEDGTVPLPVLSEAETAVSVAVQLASNFEALLTARANVETVWQELSDFSNLSVSDYPDFLKNLDADVLVVGSVLPQSSGSKITMQAISLKGEVAGSVLYAGTTPSVDLQSGVAVIDAKSEVIQTLNDIKAELMSLEQLGGLIGSPDSTSQFYHNARLYAQRGEIDLAIQMYIGAIGSKSPAVDPVFDLVGLAKRLYGDAGALKFVEIKLRPLVSEQIYVYAKLLVDPSNAEEAVQLLFATPASEVTPPLVWEVLRSQLRISQRQTHSWVKWRVWTIYAELLDQYVRDGTFQAYYIDQIRAATVIAEIKSGLEEIVMRAKGIRNDVSLSPIEISYPTWGGVIVEIEDSMDIRGPLALCADDSALHCFDMTKMRCPDGSRRVEGKSCIPFEERGAWSGPSNNGDSWDIESTLGTICIASVSYIDKRGVIVNSLKDEFVVITHGHLAPSKAELQKCEYTQFSKRN